MTSGLRGAREDYGARGVALIDLALQDLFLVSPVIVLSGLLFAAAAAITVPLYRRRPTGTGAGSQASSGGGDSTA